MVKIASRSSEILLIAVLIVIVGFIRVYFGGPDGFMVVWKGEWGYKDTFVNLDDFYKIPKGEALAEHHNVLYQLEEMGLTSPDH
jgi:hypothetical protein